MRRTKQNGMTLIELMIALAIVGILATASIYLYSAQVRRGRRVDGINAVLSISLAQERYRSNNPQYGTLAQVWGGSTTSPDGYYSLAVSNVSATSYTITATAQGNQANDTACTNLILAVNNGTITKTPDTCWPK